MTEPRAQSATARERGAPAPPAGAPPHRRRAASGSPPALLWLAAALFLALLALLAARVSGGQDPALRARAASAPLPLRRVLVRKIYERRVIVHLPASSPPQAVQSSQQVSAAGGYASAPLTRTS